MQNKIFLTFFLFLSSTLIYAQPDRYLPGRDYTVIENPATDHTPDIVEVTEYFWYGCPGCYAFEPQLSDWIKKQNEQVTCLRLPAIWDNWHEVHARAYYTADSLGILDQMHSKVFDAMHVQGNRLRDESELRELFVANGVSETDFNKAYHSFSVSSEISRARNLATQYQARSTPSIIVNGKFLVALSNQTLDVVDFLVQKELM